jgi:ParB/RepB/Spo0J family partition protein
LLRKHDPFKYKSEHIMTTAAASVTKNVPFNQIEIVEDVNSRTKLKGIEELAENIKENGLLSSLVVTNGGSEKKPYRLVAGFRRGAALTLLKWGSKEVPVVIRDVASTPIDNLIENVQREDLHPLDLAEQLRKMVEGTYAVLEGEEARVWDRKELAAKLGMTAVNISNYVRVATNISGAVKRKVQNRTIAFRVLIRWASLDEDEQLVACEEWIATQDGFEKKPQAESAGGDEEGGDEDEAIGGSTGPKKPGKKALTQLAELFVWKSEHTKGSVSAEASSLYQLLRFVNGDIQRLPPNIVSGEDRKGFKKFVEEAKVAEKAARKATKDEEGGE